jgi:hypothetical protein
VQYPVHMSAGAARRRAFFFRYVRVHDHQPRAGILLNQAGRRIMVAVSVADQQNLRRRRI